MDHIIDARGYNCPQPVIMTKKAIDSGLQMLTTIVAQKSALENVSRYAKGQGFVIQVEQRGGDYYIHMQRGDAAAEEYIEPAASCALPAESGDVPVTVLITSNQIGQGAQELGETLMKSFLYSLYEWQGKVASLLFMNAGVFLTTEGSPVLEQLIALQQQGTAIQSCGTCLDYYGLKEKLIVGDVTNMYQVVEWIATAPRSITI